jgi:hypothetical protein
VQTPPIENQHVLASEADKSCQQNERRGRPLGAGMHWLPVICEGEQQVNRLKLPR